MAFQPSSESAIQLDQVNFAAVEETASILRQGGLVAYPTEAVWGLGCDPFNARAVQRLLLLKQRDPAKGVILIASSMEQLKPWLTQVTPQQRQQLEASWPGPVTWLIEDQGYTPELILGRHTSVALRVTAHPWVRALCDAFGGPIVSTSANTSGQPPLQTSADIEQTFGMEIDALLDGPLGGLNRPSRICDLATGEILRP